MAHSASRCRTPPALLTTSRSRHRRPGLRSRARSPTAVGTIGSADVTDVAVTCATGTFSIVVTVSGLAGSGPLVLQNNAWRRSDHHRQRHVPVQRSARVRRQYRRHGSQLPPTNPTQSCAVDNGSGTVGAANVTNITVTCMTNSFTIGGPISGLTGSGLQLRLNNGPPLNAARPCPAVSVPGAAPERHLLRGPRGSAIRAIPRRTAEIARRDARHRRATRTSRTSQ